MMLGGLAGRAGRRARARPACAAACGPAAADDGVIDLAGNDYLGLSRHPAVVAAAAAGGPHLGRRRRCVPAGHRQPRAARRPRGRARPTSLGQPAALVMSTGYHANLAAVTALADRDCLIVSDAHVHASLVDAARLARAEVAVVPHNDVAAVSTALAGAGGRRAMVLAESIYSVLGDAAPLLELAGVCASYDALLVVDEAHGLGVAGAGGRGLVADLGLAGQRPRRRHRDPVQGARRPGRRGARLPRRRRAPGQPRPAVHLRHRPRPARRPPGALAALDVLRAQPTLPGVDHGAGGRPGRRARRRRAQRRGAVGADAVAAGRGRRAGRRPRRGRPGRAASGRRRCPTGSPGCGSPPTPACTRPTGRAPPPSSARSSRSTAPCEHPRRHGDRHRRRQDRRDRCPGGPGGRGRFGRRREAGADRGRRRTPTRSPTPTSCTRSPAAPSRSSPACPTRSRPTPRPGCAGCGSRRSRSTPTGSGCWRSSTTP